MDAAEDAGPAANDDGQATDGAADMDAEPLDDGADADPFDDSANAEVRAIRCPAQC